jgi:hypothetical protein
MYQMNDKAFGLFDKKPSGEGKGKKCEEIAAERQKGKLNIFSAISVIFLTFNMFFASHIFRSERARGYCAKMHLFICVPT